MTTDCGPILFPSLTCLFQNKVMFLLKVILLRTFIERPNFNFSATCQYPRGWPLNGGLTVIPKASFFFFYNGAVVFPF